MFSSIALSEAVPGNVIARVDHFTGALQINPERFSKLSQLDREFVLIHELAHLQLNETDERKTNLAALAIFLHRGKIKGDYQKRVQWVANKQNYSNVTNIADAVNGVANLLNTSLNKLFEDKDARADRDFLSVENDKDRSLEEFLARMKQDGYLYIAGIVLLVFIGLITFKLVK